MKMIENASPVQIYNILATLECAHEPDQIEHAHRQLREWGCTREELVAEWDRREAIRLLAAKTVPHVPV